MCIIVIIVFLFGSSILGQLFFLCVFSTFYFDDLHQSLFMDSYLYNMLCRCVVGKVFHVSYAYVYIYIHMICIFYAILSGGFIQFFW